MTIEDPGGRHRTSARKLVALSAWTLGLGSALTAFGMIHGSIVNVVNYRVLTIDVPASVLPFLAPALALVAAVLLIRTVPMSTLRAALPLTMSAAVCIAWLAGTPPTFITLCIAILGVGWSIDRLGAAPAAAPGWFRHVDRLAPALLALAIAASTAWHALAQIRFWEHFLLGYADFGLFTTELEHCIPWKEVGLARFSGTRMGYHFEPMFYLLAPAYALVRSPVFLMIVGPLALNLAAIPFYLLARHRTGSAAVALLVALAWLALPSISRMPYSNTYGFESVYLAVPWLAAMLSFALCGRWRASLVCLAGALLCQETICGVALGWGVYLMIWGGRRRDGLWIVAISVVYLLITTLVVIPHFAPSAQYDRVVLFGDPTMGDIVARLTRPRVWFYLLALALPLLPALFRRPRLLIAALPPLCLILLLKDGDYLNIKYWHQSSILPVMFAAATLGVTTTAVSAGRRARPGPVSLGPPLAMCVAVFLFHQWMGSSPFTQAYRLQAADGRLRVPDPRMAAVDYVRGRYPRESTTVIATERMAAHFTDYRMVHPAARTQLGDAALSPAVLIVDRSDSWDRIVRLGRVRDFLARAGEVGFTSAHTEGSVLILTNFARLPATADR